MATENSQAKAATKNDKDAPTIEVKEETSSDGAATKEASKPTATKEEPKSAAAKEAPKSAAAKEEPKPAPAPAPAAKEATKPAPAPAPAAKEATKPAPAPAAKEEPKPAPAPAAKEEPKPAPAPAPAAKEATKPAPAAKEAPKPAPAAEAPRPAAPRPPPVDTVSRVGRAEAIVRRNVLWSLGAGVVPFPVFDAIAIATVQLKMLSELSELYKVDFTESVAKKLIGSLLSSIGGVALGSAVGSSLMKMVPGIGTALGIVSVPLIGGAATHATGTIFVMHFEAGGTLLDFDPHKMRSYFKQEFEKARQTVAEVQKNEQAKGNKTS